MNYYVEFLGELKDDQRIQKRFVKHYNKWCDTINQYQEDSIYNFFFICYNQVRWKIYEKGNFYIKYGWSFNRTYAT